MIRLDKYLAHAKVGTRKEVKKLIRQGHIRVNGEICRKDDEKIDETNVEVLYDEEVIDYQEFYYIMLNKPPGYVSSNVDELDPSVLHLIDEVFAFDLFCVGRLDVDTHGLLLLTNDGKFAHHLLSPRHNIEKEYYVELANNVSDSDIQQLENGILIDDRYTKPAKVIKIDTNIVHLIIREGKFHQVKRMFIALGNEVVYLKRIRIGLLGLDESLEEGSYRFLSEKELQLLKGD